MYQSDFECCRTRSLSASGSQFQPFGGSSVKSKRNEAAPQVSSPRCFAQFICPFLNITHSQPRMFDASIRCRSQLCLVQRSLCASASGARHLAGIASLTFAGRMSKELNQTIRAKAGAANPGATQSAIAVRGVGNCGNALAQMAQTCRAKPWAVLQPRCVGRSPNALFGIKHKDRTKLPCQ